MPTVVQLKKFHVVLFLTAEKNDQKKKNPIYFLLMISQVFVSITSQTDQYYNKSCQTADTQTALYITKK